MKTQSIVTARIPRMGKVMFSQVSVRSQGGTPSSVSGRVPAGRPFLLKIVLKVFSIEHIFAEKDLFSTAWNFCKKIRQIVDIFMQFPAEPFLATIFSSYLQIQFVTNASYWPLCLDAVHTFICISN